MYVRALPLMDACACVCLFVFGAAAAVVVVVVAATVHRRHLSCANWASGATLNDCNRLLCEA